jgi:hypothetical protein
VVGERIVNDTELPASVAVVNIDNCELIVEKMRERQREAYSRPAGRGVATSQSDKKQRRAAGGKGAGVNGGAASGEDAMSRCTYEVMSVEQMTLDDSSFDLCLDKGCLGTHTFTDLLWVHSIPP